MLKSFEWFARKTATDEYLTELVLHFHSVFEQPEGKLIPIRHVQSDPDNRNRGKFITESRFRGLW